MSDRRGQPPEKWGSCGWAFLHYTALGYPASQPTPADRRLYRGFVYSLVSVLPCSMCRDNLRRHLTHAAPDAALAEGRDAFFAWTVRLHNIVNRETGRPTVDVRAARRLYAAGPRCRCEPPGALAADLATGLLILALVLVVVSAVSGGAARR